MIQSTAMSKQKIKDPKRYEKVIPERPKCIRCGVCCITAPCGMGKISNKTGLCLYLTIHKEGYTSCKYIEKNGNLLFIGGCFLRHNGEIYKHYKEEAEAIVGIKLVGIKREKGGNK